MDAIAATMFTVTTDASRRERAGSSDRGAPGLAELAGTLAAVLLGSFIGAGLVAYLGVGIFHIVSAGATMASMEKPIPFDQFGSVFYAGLIVTTAIAIPFAVRNWVAERRESVREGVRRGLHEANETRLADLLRLGKTVRVPGRIRRTVWIIVLGAAGNFLYTVLAYLFELVVR